LNYIEELCLENGIDYNKVDTTLPQDWVDDFYKVTGQYPAARGWFVWSYEHKKWLGEPIPLNDEAAEWLERYNIDPRLG
jgi:hypothetical protein